MTAIRFNPLTYANKLKEAGTPDKQAEAMAQLQGDILINVDDINVATRRDIQDIKELIHTSTYKIIGLLAALQALFHFIK